jgi:hypothetical protein
VTIPLPPGQTPYITASMLLDGSWPTGVSFKSLPPGRTVAGAANVAAVTNIAAQATADCDAYCNQPLRCTLTTEVFRGPGDFRTQILPGSGQCRVILQRLPILAVTSVQVAPSAVPPALRQWTVLPAGYYEAEYPALGLYDSIAPSAGGQGGQAILITPPYVNWGLGRHGYVIQVSYYHGWPHTSLTATAEAGATSISVDDCTGWGITTLAGTGAAGVAYDSGSQEAVRCTATSVTAGPGTLTLASPLAYEHGTGVMVSSFPQNIIWASALFSAAAALTRGATSTTIQDAPGRGAGGKGAEELANEAEIKLHPYRRTI